MSNTTAFLFLLPTRPFRITGKRLSCLKMCLFHLLFLDGSCSRRYPIFCNLVCPTDQHFPLFICHMTSHQLQHLLFFRNNSQLVCLFRRVLHNWFHFQQFCTPCIVGVSSRGSQFSKKNLRRTYE